MIVGSRTISTDRPARFAFSALQMDKVCASRTRRETVHVRRW